MFIEGKSSWSKKDSIEEIFEYLDKKQANEQKLYKSLSSSTAEVVDPSDKNLLNILKSGKIQDFLNDKRLFPSLLYTLTAIILFLLIYFIFFSSNDDYSEELENNNEIENVVEYGKDEKTIFDYFKSGQDSIVLEAIALDTAWVKITIDGNITDEILLYPKMKKIWKAKEYFIFTQGNAGALQLKRNGDILEPMGTRGSVIKQVKITEKEVIK